MVLDPADDEWVYDEWAHLHENAADVHVDASAVPSVRRIGTRLVDGRTVSGLRWGDTDPQLVVVHGSAQNAHTWDSTLIRLGRPALAVDLPGHGHSSWRDDRTYHPTELARDLAAFVEEHAATAALICGMSLGGMTVLQLARQRPDLVRRFVMVDITPGVTRDKAKEIHDFIAGPQSFPAFSDIFDRTVEHNPTRSEASLRRGIVHNARKLDDGSWEWRYDRRGPADGTPAVEPKMADAARAGMWDDLAATTQPLLLVRGDRSPVVDDDDVAELRRRRPDARVVVVADAGHSVQGDQPVELAQLLEAELSPG
ncbi:MAG: alpha/beta hydrolase [Actinomycetota bacterium]